MKEVSKSLDIDWIDILIITKSMAKVKAKSSWINRNLVPLSSIGLKAKKSQDS